MTHKRVGDVQERRHSRDIRRAGNRKTGDNGVFAGDEAEWVALYTGKDYGKKHSYTHRHSAEHTETAELGERPREAEEEADDGADETPYDGARCIAVRQRVKQFRSHKAMQRCREQRSALTCKMTEPAH